MSITFKYILVLTLSAFIGCSETKEHQSLPDPYEAGWNGQKVCEVIEDNNKVRILKCIFPPGVGHEMHYHNPHTGYTLAGGKFRIINNEGTREVDVPSGTTFSNSEVTIHEVLNIGETTASFLIIEYK